MVTYHVRILDAAIEDLSRLDKMVGRRMSNNTTPT
jgi:hypothetical protein